MLAFVELIRHGYDIECVPYFRSMLYVIPQGNIGSTKVRLPLMRIGAAEGVQPVGKVAHGGMRRKFRIECLHRHM